MQKQMYCNCKPISMAPSPLFSFLLQLSIFVIVNVCKGTDVPRFPAVLVFGDSTSDTGNNNYIPTLAKANHYPYGKDFPGHIASGRFSNGKLIADFLVSMLGIKDTIPPFLQPNLSDAELCTGVTFASGGSGYDDLTAAMSNVIPLSQQAAYFRKYIERLKGVVREEEAQRIVNNDALVTITSGANDFIFNIYGIPSRVSQLTIDEYQNYILNRLQDFVKELYQLGCRTMVIAGLPPIGCLPSQMTARVKNPFSRTCVETQNLDAQTYNKKLVELLPRIEASLYGTKILYADAYQSAMELIVNPRKHGLIETTRGCCGTGLYEAGPTCTPFSPTCSDASKYLFFDSIHPGETAYRYIAKALKNDILQNYR